MMKTTMVLGAVGVAAMSPQEADIARMEMIKKVNTMPGMTWKAGMNEKFKGQVPGSSKSLLGVKYDAPFTRAQKIKEGKIKVVNAPADFAPPDNFDSMVNWPQCKNVIDNIRDQSNCGCCWAFGGASAASDRMCIASNGTVTTPISAQDVCFCGSFNGCGGGYLEAAWDYIQAGVVSGGQQEATGPLGGGFCSAYSLPHCHHHGPQGDDPYPAEGQPGCPSESSPQCPSKCDSDAKAPFNKFSDKFTFKGGVESYENEAAIQAAIMSAGPVETAFTVYSDFENYAGGIYQKTSDEVLGGHAVRIVGWGVDAGTKYWKVANSWNPWWGEKGYFRIIRGVNSCSIESQGMASAADSTWDGPGF